MRHIGFEYNFFAIGQGLFSAGFLRDETCRIRFRWIFDCGTKGKHDYLHREINYLKTNYIEEEERIELFCLSHFDEDHINGARQLLSEHAVDTLVMPYIPLIQRIQIAIDTTTASNDYILFLMDPAQYMFTVAGQNLNRIVYIVGSDGSAEEISREEPSTPPSNDNWDLDLPESKVPPPVEDLYSSSDTNSEKTKPLLFLADNKSFTVANTWEFCFYNETVPKLQISPLRTGVLRIIQKYKTSTETFDGYGLLRELKDHYLDHFGTSHPAQNTISLVVYTGPIRHKATTPLHLCYCLQSATNSLTSMVPCFLEHSTQQKVSLCYFGDYTLKAKKRLAGVKQHFGQVRWDKIEIIQVPHHGASTSWPKGTSAVFGHHASVISSGCVSMHPTQVVLDDLKSHGVILVNEMQRARFAGWVSLR